MIVVEIANRSELPVEEDAVLQLAQRVLAAEGIHDGELGISFVGPDEIRALKKEHLDIDEPTDVLSFPLDGRGTVPDGTPRALGDVVICPQFVGADWREPLVHGLLHLLGFDHGDEMDARERQHVAR